ncbi:hypothetical protein [Mesorhizobium sp. J428]|uniref:hypothetical protein n=1 Tax=Mesorhizobium sp. J428 TaxID=2898440 RepID=UPI002151320C|nr:hypothetical protein [Mesorhizobium sp. J428]MCR5856004.1 hypothetical protein [Mesorhizobium sp. J428]
MSGHQQTQPGVSALTLLGRRSISVPMSSTRLETIGDLVDGGYSLHYLCWCGRHGWLDLEGIAEGFGRDIRYLHDNLTRRLSCVACKRKGQITYRLHGPLTDGTPVSRERPRMLYGAG